MSKRPSVSHLESGFSIEQPEIKEPTKLDQLLQVDELQRELQWWTTGRLKDLCIDLGKPEASKEVDAYAKEIAKMQQQLTAAGTALAGSPEVQAQWASISEGAIKSMPQAVAYAEGLLSELCTAMRKRRIEAEHRRMEETENIQTLNTIEGVTDQDAAWSLTGVAPVDYLTPMPREERYQEETEQQRKEWNDCIAVLQTLPGPHHAALQAYLHDSNAQTAYALIVAAQPASDRDLELGFSQKEMDDLNTLLDRVRALRLPKSSSDPAPVAAATPGRARPFTPSAPERTQPVQRMECEPSRETIELFGDRYLGPQQVREVLGIELSSDQIPPLTYTDAQLEQAAREGYQLVLFVGVGSQGEPLSAQRLQQLTEEQFHRNNRFQQLLDRRDLQGYNNESFFTEKPVVNETRWQLVASGVLPGSNDKTYAEQTRVLRDDLASRGELTVQQLAQCSDDVLTNLGELAVNARWGTPEWAVAAQRLAALDVNQLHRLSFGQEVYRTVLSYLGRGSAHFSNQTNWTNDVSSRGDLVLFSCRGASGCGADFWRPHLKSPDLGVIASR